jgi:hypothetical protein
VHDVRNANQWRTGGETRLIENTRCHRRAQGASLASRRL